MMTFTPHPAPDSSPLRLRGKVHPFLTVEIADVAVQELDKALTARLAATAGLFRHTPAILDLTALPATSASRVAEAVALLRQRGLVPAAFKAQAIEVEQAALANGLGRVLDPEPRQNLAAERIRRPPLIVSEPVRSGQRVYAVEADLIVLHSVSPGAQLLADGCIHVYGALRGSASAGLGDDPAARIFAKIFDAEMVAIAGLYLGADEFPASWVNSPIQISLADGALRFAPLP
ncbi:septum site-determining protein MinC [Acetobacteraceae bacterium AT-5844]|nr:septum site-determining protein MinC [Acetobacteraceae bacterium AT-5844]